MKSSETKEISLSCTSQVLNCDLMVKIVNGEDFNNSPLFYWRCFWKAGRHSDLDAQWGGEVRGGFQCFQIGFLTPRATRHNIVLGKVER